MKPTTLTHRATAGLGAALLVLGLAACGSDDDPVEDETTTSTQGTGSSDEPAEGNADETTPDAGDETTPDDAGETTDEGSGGGVSGSEGVSSADVEAARAGLAAYLEANMPATPQTSTNIPGCPAVEQAVLEDALAGAGYPGTSLGGWGTEIEWDEYEGVGQDVIGIVCGGDSDGNPNDSDFGVAAGVIAVDLKGTGAAPEDLFGDAERTAGPEGIGGEVASLCQDDTFCFAAWISDDLVLGTVLNTDGATEESARTLLDATLPSVLETLAGN